MILFFWTVVYPNHGLLGGRGHQHRGEGHWRAFSMKSADPLGRILNYHLRGGGGYKSFTLLLLCRIQVDAETGMDVNNIYIMVFQGLFAMNIILVLIERLLNVKQ